MFRTVGRELFPPVFGLVMVLGCVPADLAGLLPSSSGPSSTGSEPGGPRPNPTVPSDPGSFAASFTVTTERGVAPLAVSFDASDSKGAISIYTWSFGDGAAATGKTTQHTYKAPGTYVARLTIISGTNEQSVAVRTITVLFAIGSVAVSQLQVNFAVPGQTQQLTAMGTLASGVKIDLNAAGAGLSYTSGNPDVATVDAGGMLTAVAKGTTGITVQYENLPPVTVSVAVKPLLAATAARVITPVTPPGTPLANPAREVNHSDPVWIAGFGTGRRASRVQHDLWARGLVLQRDDVTVALVVVDLIGYFHNEVETIRSLLNPSLGIDYLVVASTHNHEGPDTLGQWGPDDWTSGIDPSYLDFVNQQIVETVEQAAAELREVKVKFATTPTGGISMALDPSDDGFGVADTGVLDGDTKVPGNIDGRIVDPDLVSIQLVSLADDSTIATLTGFASHPEALGASNTSITPDFPHYIRQRLESVYGGLGIFVSADLGALQGPLNIDVRDPQTGLAVGRRTFRFAQILGEALANRAIFALDRVEEYSRNPVVDFRSTNPVFVPVENPAFRARWAAGVLSNRRFFFSNGQPDRTIGLDPVLEKFPVAAGQDLRTEVGTFRVGQAAFIVMPNELDPQIANIYKSMLPNARHRFIVGLGNDELGYEIPPAKLNTAFYECFYYILDDRSDDCPSINNVSTATYFANNVGRQHEPRITEALSPLLRDLDEALRSGSPDPSPPADPPPQPIPPLTVFTVDTGSGVAPLAVSFNATASAGAAGPVTEYNWTLGDETTAQGPAVEHTYDQPGLYEVVLTVIGPDGQSDRASLIVTVFKDIQSLAVSPASINFASFGQAQQLTVTGVLADGTDVDLTSGDSGTTYVSSEPDVASVSTDGLVTALAPGTAQITVAYGNDFSGTVSVTVAPLYAGVSKKVITPVTPVGTPLADPTRQVNHSHPVYMAGFGDNRPATGVHDDLWARALAVRYQDKTIAIVSIDVVGYGYHEVEKIRALVNPRIDLDYLVVTSTHNHEGPDTVGIWGPDSATTGVDPDYIDFVNAAVVDVAEQAVNALQPAKVKIATASSQGLSMGLDPEDDGFGVSDGKVLLGDDVVTGVPSNVDGRIVDPNIFIMQFVDIEAASTIATFLNFASHPESLGSGNTKITSDFPHYIRRRLEEMLGGTAIHVSGDLGVLQGPLDIDIIDPDTGVEAVRRTFRWAEVQGLILADRALQALQAVSDFSTLPKVDYRVADRVDVPLANPYFRVAFGQNIVYPERKLYTNGIPDTRQGFDPFFGAIPIGLGEDVRTEVAVLRIAEAGLVVVPGELDPQIGFQYRALLSNAAHTAIIGLGNDEIGYQLQKSKFDSSCHDCAYYDMAGQPCPIPDPDCNTVFRNNVGPQVDPTVSGAIIPLLTSLNNSFADDAN